jgi:hypothetical protein
LLAARGIEIELHARAGWQVDCLGGENMTAYVTADNVVRSAAPPASRSACATAGWPPATIALLLLVGGRRRDPEQSSDESDDHDHQQHHVIRSPKSRPPRAKREQNPRRPGVRHCRARPELRAATVPTSKPPPRQPQRLDDPLLPTGAWLKSHRQLRVLFDVA